MIEITDEMVEAGALAAKNLELSKDGSPEVASFLDAYDAEYWREDARAAIAAVAPLIAAAEREECARIADMYADENIRMAGDSIINDPLLRRARTGDKAPMQAADWALVEKCTDDGTVHSSMFHAAQNIARAIRARGDKP